MSSTKDMSILSRSQTRIKESVRISSCDISTLTDRCLQSSLRARPCEDRRIHSLATPLKAHEGVMSIGWLSSESAANRGTDTIVPRSP